MFLLYFVVYFLIRELSLNRVLIVGCIVGFVGLFFWIVILRGLEDVLVVYFGGVIIFFRVFEVVFCFILFEVIMLGDLLRCFFKDFLVFIFLLIINVGNVVKLFFFFDFGIILNKVECFCYELLLRCCGYIVFLFWSLSNCCYIGI